MIELLRTDATHPDFVGLVRLLDAELAVRDGEDHAFYHQFNHIEAIQHAVIAYSNGLACGCGAIKAFAPREMEVKRMFVRQEARKQGLATQVLLALENWARELECHTCVLETGKQQPEAIALYEKNGYRLIPNYGQYIGVENSVCFKKMI